MSELKDDNFIIVPVKIPSNGSCDRCPFFYFAIADDYNYCNRFRKYTGHYEAKLKPLPQCENKGEGK